MRLSGPNLDEDLRGTWLRSLRVFIVPVILALALYAFYAIGGYGVREAPPKPPLHGSIYGTVVDEKQRPVYGVSVTIAYASSKDPMPYLSPATDSQGHFYLQDLPSGSYILQASADGFDMQTQSTGVSPGKTTRLTLPIYRQTVRGRKPRP